MGTENSARYYHIDQDHMIDHVIGIPDQINAAWRMAGDFAFSRTVPGAPIVVCGMGGSAIGAILLRDLIARDSTIPIHVARGYALPTFADRDTAVVCVSYSGNTEETLESFHHAQLLGCPLAVITSGGRLGTEAAAARVPVLTVPGGMPPRAAIGYLFTPLLRLVSNLGIYSVTDDEVGSAVRKTRRLARRYSLDAEQTGNAALQLAKKLYGKIPLIYSGGGLLGGLGYRWKCQFNENSKSMAFSNIFPELGHNEVTGWECPEKMREDLFVIMLRDIEDHPRVQKRMDVTYSMLEPLTGGAVMIDSVGVQGREGRFQRLLSILVLGDLASVYLAVEYGKDPTPIEHIEAIKKYLRTEDG
ncbi:MAG TPA: bifunctional phosphoglucose/phosphomannose isomerase [Patescibacteria group bacterium]|nr:bifunctional phosphoglucose/phosphomannose isomerase [Patescibacteria group bacterium]